MLAACIRNKSKIRWSPILRIKTKQVLKIEDQNETKKWFITKVKFISYFKVQNKILTYKNKTYITTETVGDGSYVQ